MTISNPSYLKLHCVDHELGHAVESVASVETEMRQTELAAQSAFIASDAIAKQGLDQINRILSDIVLATSSDAAAVYMLDDETERLTTRFALGAITRIGLGLSRPLRGARGDLEAMVQGIFTTDDLPSSSLGDSAVPEPFPSAICICLGGIELPVGTLWLFSKGIHTFNNQSEAAARLAAENICHVLVSLKRTRFPVQEQTFDNEIDFDADRFVAAMEPMPLSGVRVTEEIPAEDNHWANQVANWQFETLPLGSRLADGWSVDGMIESLTPVAQSWHHWDVLPDGVLTIAMCHFGNECRPEDNLVGTLDATVVRAALQSHIGYRHTPHGVVTRIMHTLLQVRDGAIDESGSPNLSLLYAHIDPETGRAVISSIGRWSSLIVSKYGYRPLSLGRTTGSASDTFLGELSIANHETTLLEGEALLLSGANWMGMGAGTVAPSQSRYDSSHNVPGSNPAESAQHQIGAALKRAMSEGERSPLSALRRHCASLLLTQERSAVALLHESNR